MERSDAGYASQEVDFGTWVTVFLQMTFLVILLCGLVSYGIIGVFTTFKVEDIHWKAIFILGGILFLPSWYYGIQWFRMRRRKVRLGQK